MTVDEIANELNKPLQKSHVKPAQKYGPKGDYLEGWFVIEEANRIFGWDGWSYDIATLDVVSERERGIGKDKTPGFGVTYTCRVSIRVGDARREDVGAGHGYDVDCGLAHESAIKEAVTDALKRALRTFGNPFGLALYDKTRANVEDDTKPVRVTENTKAAAPDTPRTLTYAEGVKIMAQINELTTAADVATYFKALLAGPMAFAADHPKIIAARDSKLDALEGPTAADYLAAG